MLPAGLGFLSVSQKALAAAKTARHHRCYFSFDDMIRDQRHRLFPLYAATQLLRGLRASLDLIAEEGLENIFARHHRLADGVRKAVDAWGLRLCAKEPKWHSDTVSAILVPEGIDSADVVRRAYHTYNTSLGIGLNKVAGKVFRIGHLGWLNEVMVLRRAVGGRNGAARLRREDRAGLRCRRGDRAFPPVGMAGDRQGGLTGQAGGKVDEPHDQPSAQAAPAAQRTRGSGLEPGDDRQGGQRAPPTSSSSTSRTRSRRPTRSARARTSSRR